MARLFRYLCIGFSIFLLLAGCTGGTKQVLAVTESVQASEEELVKELNKITKVESELQGAFEKTLDEDEKLETLADGTSDVYANIDSRKESLDKVEEILGQLQEDYSSLADNDKVPEAERKELTTSLEAVTDTLDKYMKHYKETLADQKSFFESLAGEDATYETMTEGIDTISSESETTRDYLLELDQQLVSLEETSNTVKSLLNEEIEG